MNFHQRSDQSVPAISGRKISNYFTCTVKQVRKLSPQLYQQTARQKTFQTDSFKQILTKRSGCPSNKENISAQNKVLKRIKEEPLSRQNQKSQQNKKKAKSNQKRVEKKSSSASLAKLYQRNKSSIDIRKKQVKSVSPSKDLKEYRSGPIEKKNHISNYTSHKVKEITISKSQKNLSQKIKNPLKSLIQTHKKQEKIEKKQKQQTKVKKQKNASKNLNAKKQNKNISKTQALAKQFDLLLKRPKQKVKKNKNKSKSKQISKKSKQKKVIVSHNNSKNHLSKNKLNSCYSDQSAQSPERQILSTRYDLQNKNSKRKRLSFEPSRVKGKSNEKAKTEALSPQKNLANKNEAATLIQKVFRGYLTRKYIAEFKRILFAVITIQRFWRGYKSRKQVKNMKNQQNKFKKQLRLQCQESLLKSNQNQNQVNQSQLQNLLQEILKQDNVNEKIKSKINEFLKKQDRILSSRSHSIKSHLQQQMKSQKKFFEEIQKKKNKFGSPVMKISPGPTPKLSKSDLHQSPEIMIQNLLTIKQFQRQKLINNAHLQIEGIQSLTMKNIFSPRTKQIKLGQVHRKLKEELKKFDESIGQVIKTCKQSEQIVGEIKPFEAPSTPQKNNILEKEDFGKYLQNSPHMSPQQKFEFKKNQEQKLNSSQRKLQDLSMQLLQYYEQKSQSRHQRQYQKIDSSYQFIEQYLLSLFQFLRQMGQQYRQSFIDIMRSSRNLQINCFLKNLNILTEDSDQDISFKLPMYKYLEKQSVEVLSLDVAEQFNGSYNRLQRHQLGLKINLQEIYLKMIIEAVNQALNLQRPNNYIFTQTSLYGRSTQTKILQLQALDGLDGDDNEPQFSFYFANSMNHIYKWAHLQCGKIADEQNEEPIMYVNQKSLEQYLKYEVNNKDNYYDQLLQVIVTFSNQIFEEIIYKETFDIFYRNLADL